MLTFTISTIDRLNTTVHTADTGWTAKSCTWLLTSTAIQTAIRPHVEKRGIVLLRSILVVDLGSTVLARVGFIPIR